MTKSTGKGRSGRPPLPPGVKRTGYLQVRVRPSELAELERLAAASELTLGEYVRASVLGWSLLLRSPELARQLVAELLGAEPVEVEAVFDRAVEGSGDAVV